MSQFNEILKLFWYHKGFYSKNHQLADQSSNKNNITNFYSTQVISEEMLKKYF